MAAKLIIEIVTEASKAKKELAETSDGVKSVGKSADIMGKALIAGAAAGAAGLVALGVGAFNAAAESAKIGRETERVIKTIGAASWTSAAQVQELAGAISDKTGADDEAIQSGANLLLTFANVKNEVGEGNDVFDQATGLALDMSTALGTDMSGAAVQLGKALNDPLKGITALSKAGVSFTEDQKAQIKLMAESGDLLGAQKIVLAELSKEFKGAAEAAGTPLDKLMVAAGNLQEELGAKLIPAVDAVAGVLANTLGPAFEAVSGFVSEHTELIKFLGSVGLAALAAAYGPVVAQQALMVASGVKTFLFETAAAAFVAVDGFLAMAASEGIATAATTTLNAALTASGPMLAIVALGAAVYGMVSAFTSSSEAAEKFIDSVREDVPTGDFDAMAESQNKIYSEGRKATEMLNAQRGTLSGIAGGVVDILVPFHDMKDSMVDNAQAVNTLADEHTEYQNKLDAANLSLATYAETSVLAAHGLDTTSKACLVATEANKPLLDQMDATAETMRQIAKEKGIDPVAPGAVEKIQALYDKTQFATTGTLNMSEAQEKYNDAASTAKDKTDAYKQSLDALVGVHLSAAQAETQYSENSLALLGKLNENRAIANGLTDASQATTLAQTAAINENNAAIQGNVKSAMDLANATFQETNDIGKATAELEQHRAGLVKVMMQNGYTEESAKAYIDRLGLTPENINTQVNLANAQANTAIDTTQGKLDVVGQGANPAITANTAPAAGPIADVQGQINEVKQGGTATITANTKPAKDELSGLGRWWQDFTRGLGVIGDAFGGKADGGPVLRGQPYMVGERGPELFVPRTGGAIIPTSLASRMSGPSGGTVINVTIQHSGLGIDSPKLQRDLVGALQRYTAREGPINGR